MKHRICITKEKLAYHVKSYGGKNTSVIHKAIPLIQLSLTISKSEAILSHSEWAYVWHHVMENFRYTESISCYFVITSTSGIFEALVITQAAYNEAILKVLRTSLYLVSTGERERERKTQREKEVQDTPLPFTTIMLKKFSHEYLWKDQDHRCCCWQLHHRVLRGCCLLSPWQLPCLPLPSGYLVHLWHETKHKQRLPSFTMTVTLPTLSLRLFSPPMTWNKT